MFIVGFVLVDESATGGLLITGFEFRGLFPFLGAALAFAGVMGRDRPLVWIGAVLATVSSMLLVYSIGLALLPAALALLLVALMLRGHTGSG